MVPEKYLNDEILKGFDNYKYNAVDTNPLSIYIMHPFWNRIVHLCPRWVAPNALTFAGFALTLTGWLILAYHDWDFLTTCPDWVYFAVPVLIFIGYTLDGIDGKQARITGTSGPLGELFDHGLDSITAVLIPVCLYSVFGREEYSVPTFRYYFVLWNVFLTFYLTHWEKYITGTLFLPWGYDFSMLSTVSVFFFTYFLGRDMWGFRIPFYKSLSAGRVLEVVFYLTSICATLPVTLYNIMVSYRDGTCRGLSFFEAIRPMIPLSFFMALTVTWAVMDSSLVERYPRAFYMLTGTVFSNITCRLVVSQMSKTRCEAWNSLINAVMVGFAIAAILPILGPLIVHILWVYATFIHVHYGSTVVRQMCDHFKIQCFKIPYKK